MYIAEPIGTRPFRCRYCDGLLPLNTYFIAMHVSACRDGHSPECITPLPHRWEDADECVSMWNDRGEDAQCDQCENVGIEECIDFTCSNILCTECFIEHGGICYACR